MLESLWTLAQGVDISTWFWIGAALLGLGCALFFVLGILDGPGHENHYTTSFFINLIAATTYAAMAFGLGQAQTGDGNVFFYARYIDWALTTPLLLLNLAMIATFNVGRKTALISGLIGLDLFMIGTGLLSAMTTGPAKWLFFGLSCFAFVGVAGILWGALRAEAAKLTWGEWETYNKCMQALTVLWLAYPVIFLLGTEGLGRVSLEIEAMLYMALDVASKLGFGVVLLLAVRKYIPKQVEEEVEDVLAVA